MEPGYNFKFVAPFVREALNKIANDTFPGIKLSKILLQQGPKGECDYISPLAMKEFNMNKDKKTGESFGCKTVQEFAIKISQHFKESNVLENIAANEQGFLRMNLSSKFVEHRINAIISNLEYPHVPKQRVAVDFSSPNIAKEMHVGHLRSTIIGESICRMMEFMGYDVLRINHVGDWGTQFGMLIAYMEVTFPDYATKTPEIKDLEAYYKAARAKFDSDPEFKKRSQETVVRLQAYDKDCIRAWNQICEISRSYFKIIYQRLNVYNEEFGESFYNKMIPPMLEELTGLGLIKEDDTVTAKKKKKEPKGKDDKPTTLADEKEEEEEESGPIEGSTTEKKMAKCIFIEKYAYPLIVVKSDGGYNYDTTDLAAVRYRLLDLKVDRAIYITDLGQREHFEMVFAAAKKAGWCTGQRLEHMGFGVILNEEKKKFSTRKGVAVKLLDLLDEAKMFALERLKNREKDTNEEGGDKETVTHTALKPEEYEDAAEKLGIAAIKYYDLKQNRTSDYIFDFDKMLDPRGNTAVYLIYAYVRMCSIIRKSGMTTEEIKVLAEKKPFVVTHPDEKILAAMLIRFYDVIEECVTEMALNKMTDFIYEICMKVQENYKKYRVIGDPQMESRIILCEAIRKVLEKAFFMVGIIPIDRI